MIGEGFHAELGGLHAERAALEDCRERGEDPAGATMYVTLEPCAHQGRQPPCVEAILEAGIARVVIASDDPSEKAAGRGPGILRDGGVEVEFAAGEEATAARLLNQPFRKHARTGLPLVTLKLAMSLDGRTATAARRLALDLGRARAAPSSTAGAPNPTRSRSASAPSSPTTRCSPPAHPRHGASTRSRRARRLRPPGPAAARLPAAAHPRPVARCSSSSRPRPTSASRPCATPAPRSLVADGIAAGASPSSAAATSPASSSRAARRSPQPSPTPARSTRRGSSSPPVLLGGARRDGLVAAPLHDPAVAEDTLITTRFKEW